MRKLVLLTILILLGPAAANEYDIEVEKVHDADTFTATIHLGFDIQLKSQTIRIDGFDAWEITRTRRTVKVTDDEITKGKEALKDLKQIFNESKRIYVVPGKRLRDNYGRLLLKVYVEDPELGSTEVGEVMRDLGHERK